jgi:hypothetical protein
MKKIIVSMCAVVVASVAVPVFASLPTEGKNNCLVYGKGCSDSAYSLPERISKLKAEIAKGEKVYTLEELKVLEHKLQEDTKTMRALNKP